MEVQSNYRVSSALTGYTSSYHQTSNTANRKNSTIAREAQRYNDNNDAGNDGNGSDCCKRNNRKYCEAENEEIGVNFNDDQLLDGGRLFYTYCSFLGTNTNKILNFLIGYLSIKRYLAKSYSIIIIFLKIQFTSLKIYLSKRFCLPRSTNA